MTPLPPMMMSLSAPPVWAESPAVCEAPPIDPGALLVSEYRQAPAAALPRASARTPFLLGIVSLLNPAGCGGKVDNCELLARGECSDAAAGIPIGGQQKPSKFDYDLYAFARGRLQAISGHQPCLLHGISSIAFVEELELGEGNYSPIARSIVINANHTTPSMDTVERHQFVLAFRLAHEIGHHVHDTLFVDPPMGNVPCTELRDRFDAVSLASPDKDTETGDFLNADAVKNADEDFAVCFAHYVVWPEQFRGRVQARIAATGDANTPLAQKYALMQELFVGYEFPDSNIK